MDKELRKNKNWLIEQYYKRGLSLREIEKKARLMPNHGATISYWMDKHNIKRRKNPKARREGVKYELLDDINWLTMQYWGFELDTEDMAKIIGVQGNKVSTKMKYYGIPIKFDTIDFFHYPLWLIEQHHDKGLSLEKMCELAGVTDLSRLMIEYNIPINRQIENTFRNENGERFCYVCKKWLDEKQFTNDRTTTDGLRQECKKCRKQLDVEYRFASRIIALQIYSNGFMKCELCGEEDVDVLTIDHINGGGRKHLKESNIKGQFVRWLKKNNYPEGYRVLCWNCQHTERFKKDIYKWDTNKDRLAMYRIAALQIYSNGYMKCAICGDDDIEHLAIDHTNGGGKQHRIKINTTIELWLMKNNYPDGFRILCHNCNHRDCL